MKRVAIITGGESSERDIALLSAENVANVLRDDFEVSVFDFPQARTEFVQRHGKFDVAIPVMHGRGGEDGEVQTFFETLGVPYLFSVPAAHAAALDKDVAKRIAREQGMHTADWWQGSRSDELPRRVPVVVKPIDGGSTIGTSVVRHESAFDAAVANAFAHSNRILIEDFISGDEFTVVVIDDAGKTIALPVIQIRARDGFFDFASKYETGSMAEELCPAPIADELSEKIQAMACAAHTAFGCRHISRTDIIVDTSGQPWFLETNTIPGMTKNSLVPKALAASGRTLRDVFRQWIG